MFLNVYVSDGLYSFSIFKWTIKSSFHQSNRPTSKKTDMLTFNQFNAKYFSQTSGSIVFTWSCFKIKTYFLKIASFLPLITAIRYYQEALHKSLLQVD